MDHVFYDGRSTLKEFVIFSIALRSAVLMTIICFIAFLFEFLEGIMELSPELEFPLFLFIAFTFAFTVSTGIQEDASRDHLPDNTAEREEIEMRGRETTQNTFW